MEKVGGNPKAGGDGDNNADGDYKEVEALFEYKFGQLVSEMHFRLLDMCEGRLIYNRARDSTSLMSFIKETSTAYFDVVDQLYEDNVDPDSDDKSYSEE